MNYYPVTDRLTESDAWASAHPCESNFTFHTISQSFAIIRQLRNIYSDCFSRTFTEVGVFWQELTDKFISSWKNSKAKINKQLERFRISSDMCGWSGKSLVTLWTWHPTSVHLRGREKNQGECLVKAIEIGRTSFFEETRPKCKMSGNTWQFVWHKIQRICKSSLLKWAYPNELNHELPSTFAKDRHIWRIIFMKNHEKRSESISWFFVKVHE